MTQELPGLTNPHLQASLNFSWSRHSLICGYTITQTLHTCTPWINYRNLKKYETYSLPHSFCSFCSHCVLKFFPSSSPYPGDSGFICFLTQGGLLEKNKTVNNTWDVTLKSYASFTYCRLSWFCILGSYQSLLEEILRAMITDSATNSHYFISA